MKIKQALFVLTKIDGVYYGVMRIEWGLANKRGRKLVGGMKDFFSCSIHQAPCWNEFESIRNLFHFKN